MTTPTNDARALYDLLEVVGAGTNTPQGAWGGVLGADYGTLEFSRRHADVVGLYTGTLAQVAALPDRSRERFQR